jgi:hypothetical protein
LLSLLLSRIDQIAERSSEFVYASALETCDGHHKKISARDTIERSAGGRNNIAMGRRCGGAATPRHWPQVPESATVLVLRLPFPTSHRNDMRRQNNKSIQRQSRRIR